MDIDNLWLALNVTGLGWALWLALLWHGRSGGWPLRRAWPVVAGALALAVAFALSVAAPVVGLAGPGATPATARLALFALPMAWLWLGRNLVQHVVPRAGRNVAALAVGLALLVALATLLIHTVWLDRMALSWLAFPLFVITLLVTVIALTQMAVQRRLQMSNGAERSALFRLMVSVLLLVVGGSLLAGDLTVGLAHPLFDRLTAWLYPSELRLIGTLALVGAGGALHTTAHAQARAEGAPFLLEQRAAWRTLGLALVATVAVSALFLRLWALPLALLGPMSLLAFVLEPILNAQPPREQPVVLRDDRLLTSQVVPSAVYTLLSHLARQINVPQLAVALPDESNGGFRVAAALDTAWEGQPLAVRNLHEWEERGVSGWNLPLKVERRTVAVLASGSNRPLNELQRALVRASGDEIAALLDAWQRLATQRHSLQGALDRYAEQSASLESRLVPPTPPQRLPDLRKAVYAALQGWANDEALRRSELAGLTLFAQTPEHQRPDAIREMLVQQVYELAPYANDDEPFMPSAEWRPHLLLKKRYLEQIPADEVAVMLDLQSRAYQHVERQAIDTVARSLAAQEAGALQLGAANAPRLQGRSSTRPAATPPPAPLRTAANDRVSHLTARFMTKARAEKPSRQAPPKQRTESRRPPPRRAESRRATPTEPPTPPPLPYDDYRTAAHNAVRRDTWSGRRQAVQNNAPATPPPASPALPPATSPPRHTPKVTVNIPDPAPNLPDTLRRPAVMGLSRPRAVPKPAADPEDQPPMPDDETPIEYD
ncbi:MAG: hypothetical protein KDD73_00630 [Anaerolineales bacterium]|nr:hypothetical protein [Anaerolineales bacterium]